MEFAFDIPGKPVPKQRPRHGKGRTFTPKKTKAAEKTVAALAMLARPRGWPMDKANRYHVEVVAVYANRRHGDLDNVVKLIQDALNGVAFPDDRQINQLKARRRFDDEPRTEVTVRVVEVNQ